MDVTMNPVEHYRYGQYLLKGCEGLAEVDHAAAASQAVIASAHFQAAASGTGINALEQMAHPLRTAAQPVRITAAMIQAYDEAEEAEPGTSHRQVTAGLTAAFEAAGFSVATDG